MRVRLSYPLDLRFKIFAIGDRIRVTDATGRQVAYVRKKSFRLREDVTVYADEEQREALYRIRTDKILDFGATYTISAADGRPFGAVRQRGMSTFWRSTYDVLGAGGTEVGLIREENPWISLANSLITLPFDLLPIPFLDLVAQSLDGLFFNPAYLVDFMDEEALRVQKRRSLLEGKFHVEKRRDFPQSSEALLLASVLMMVLLERSGG